MLRAGSAQIDITPERPIPLAGSFELRQSTGVFSRLYASAVVVDNGVARIAWIACDLLWINDETAGRLRRQIAERIDTSPANVFISCSHTHNGPILFESVPPMAPDPEITEPVFDAIVSAAADAAESLQQARMGHAAGSAKATFNRRFITADGGAICNPGPQDVHTGQPEGPVDEQVQAIWFESVEGKTLAVMVNYSSHSTLCFSDYVISADYPGEIRRALQSAHGEDTPILFLQGACGNTSPVDFLNERGDASGTQEAARVGQIIASEVIRMMSDCSPQLVDDVPIAVATETINVPTRPLGDEDQSLDEARTQIEKHPFNTLDMYDMRQMAAWYFAKSVVDMEEGPLRRDAWPVELSVLRLGDVTIAVNPAELFVEYQLEIKDKADLGVMVCELTNGHCGYILTPRALQNGSYEARRAPSSKHAPIGGQMLVDTTMKLIRKVQGI